MGDTITFDSSLTEEGARKRLREVQTSIEQHVIDRREVEQDVADIDSTLVELRREERALTVFLTPERAGVPRVIRKA